MSYPLCGEIEAFVASERDEGHIRRKSSCGPPNAREKVLRAKIAIDVEDRNLDPTGGREANKRLLPESERTPEIQRHLSLEK